MINVSFMDMLREIGTSGIIIIAIIIFVFIVALLTNFITILRYKSISSCFDNKKQTKTGIFSNELLNSIVQEYKIAAKNSLSEVNTQAIIEKSFNENMKLMAIAESFVKKSPAILVILGLFGTFWGLTASVTKLIEIITSNIINDVEVNMGQLLESLSGTASGMGVAFSTSLFGIAFNILLTVIFIFASCEDARVSLMVIIEEYLDNTVSIVISKDKQTEYTMLNNILRETFVEFGAKIQESMTKTVEDFGEKLTHVVMDVSLSSQTLDNTVERFDKSLENFAVNMRSLSDFNTNMRNNIQLMDVNFIRVTEALNESASVITENYLTIKEFSDKVKVIADQITAFNTDIVSQIESVVDQMEHTVSFVGKLSEELKSNTDTSSCELRKIQENFIESLHTFNQDLKESGAQLAQAITDALGVGIGRMSEDVANRIDTALKGVMNSLENFEENEKSLAKTIALLPQQVMAYNKVASDQMQEKLDELVNTVGKIEKTQTIAVSEQEEAMPKKKRGRLRI
jgi:methyl-accepting chemotaxis protein